MSNLPEKQRILAVDDEPRNLRIVLLTLGDEWEIKTAENGEEALKMMPEFAPDMVLLDIMMPGMDGYEVCKQLKANPAFELTKVILISGKAMAEERLKGYEVGANDYVTKPYVPEELVAKVRVFLDLNRVQKRLLKLNASLEDDVRSRTQQLLESEARLIESAKLSALGEMAAGIAHEINNPLAIIALKSSQLRELVAEEPLDKQELILMSQAIEQTTSRISKIISGLRLLSRDATHDALQTVPLKKIVDGTLALCSERFKLHGIETRVSEIKDSLTLSCRESQIGQVLLNLFNNAFDAIKTLDQKWIQLEIGERGDQLEIVMTDSGPGIPESTRARLFQPFFTTKEIGKGTGLGLSISRGIAQSHGGDLQLDATCKNTQFTLSLPKGSPALP